ncbi:hypothetical protein BJ166DRAFT_506677 [Pestalotiopsis sp. NC0098]|nr:hypothetical protein BJ166DRAFT_506677 [Pestalotiopsis sp. NC0098]
MPGELGEVPLLPFYKTGHALLEMLLFLPLLVADAYALHPNNLQVVLFFPTCAPIHRLGSTSRPGNMSWKQPLIQGYLRVCERAASAAVTGPLVLPLYV